VFVDEALLEEARGTVDKLDGALAQLPKRDKIDQNTESL
jgi:hypothetical protein